MVVINLHRHCWHLDDESRRKVILHRPRCKLYGDIEQYTGKNGYITYKIDEICCICHKKRVIICHDYDVDRALSYQSEEQYLNRI